LARGTGARLAELRFDRIKVTSMFGAMLAGVAT